MLPLAPELDATLLSRIEDAGLNASAPPQQRWVDGWLLRYSPGKAKRACCINALAVGRLSTERKLTCCAAVFRDAGLPMVVRITPFTQPPDLDAQLAAHGLADIDDTRVMVLGSLDGCLPDIGKLPLPAGWHLDPTPADGYADVIGSMRGLSAAERAAHAQRLVGSPVPCCPFVLRSSGGAATACGLFAREADLVGLYDVFTASAHRGRGLAMAPCARLLALAHEQGARSAYLQVESDNQAARTVYHRLGFTDGYGYHYRTPPAAAG